MEKNVITIEKDKTAQDAAKIIAEKEKVILFVKLQWREKNQVMYQFQK